MKFILSILFIILSGQLKCWGCTCIGTSDVNTAVKIAQLVVTGKVIGRKEIVVDSDTMIPDFSIKMIDYTIVISKVYKGNAGKDTIIIRTGYGNGDCGFRFIINQNYLIYAMREDKIRYTQKKPGRSKKGLRGIYRTDICTRTSELSLAVQDLIELNRK